MKTRKSLISIVVVVLLLAHGIAVSMIEEYVGISLAVLIMLPTFSLMMYLYIFRSKSKVIKNIPSQVENNVSQKNVSIKNKKNSYIGNYLNANDDFVKITKEKVVDGEFQFGKAVIFQSRKFDINIVPVVMPARDFRELREATPEEKDRTLNSIRNQKSPNSFLTESKFKMAIGLICSYERVDDRIERVSSN